MAIAALLLSTTISASSSLTIINKLFNAFNQHDTAALQALYSPNAQLTSSGFCKARTGADVARTYAAIFRDIPDIQDEVDSIVIQGDRAAARFVSSGHTPEGEVRLKLVTFFRFKHGRIIEDDTVFDAGGRACEE
jgi:predicted ester cyclase